MLKEKVDYQEVDCSGEKYQEIIEEIEIDVIEIIASTMDILGVTPSIGRLYGLMYFSEEPLTLDEMSKKTGMSKPRMSTSIRELMEIPQVKKVWRKGERKDLYEAERDFFKNFTEFYCKKWEREYIMHMEANERAFEKLNQIINAPDAPVHIREKAEKDRALLEESIPYFQWLQKLIHSLRSKDIFCLLDEGNPLLF